MVNDKYKNVYLGDSGVMTERQYKDNLLTLIQSPNSRTGIEALIQLEKHDLLTHIDYMFIKKYARSKAVRQYVDDVYSGESVNTYNL